MSIQRRRGLPITFYPMVKSVSRRGDESFQPDMDNPIHTRCSQSADRSARAELPGQHGVEVINIRVRLTGPERVGLWARAKFMGRWWDVVAPPSHRFGRAGVQHQTFLLRARPNDGRIVEGGEGANG